MGTKCSKCIIRHNSFGSNQITGIRGGDENSTTARTVYGTVRMIATAPQMPGLPMPIGAPPSDYETLLRANGKPFNVSSGADGFGPNSNFEALGFHEGTYGGRSSSDMDPPKVGRLAFQVGASANQLITIDLADFGKAGTITGDITGDVDLAVESRSVRINTREGAQAVLALLDGAMDKVNATRATMGAVMNRLTHVIDNLTNVTIPASYFRLAPYTRTYKALELTLEKPFDGKWGMQFSYVLAKSRGTAEGYVQSQLNQEDAGITQDFDFGSFTDGAKGYLPNDRRHTFKLFGTYAITDEFAVGLNATLASGRPYSCIGFVPNTVPDFAETWTGSPSSYYCRTSATEVKLVPRGTAGRTPWTHQFDVQLSYKPKWASRLTLQADVFNVFNSRKATEYNEVRDYSYATSETPPYRQNLNYGSPTATQEPRYVRLSGRYEF